MVAQRSTQAMYVFSLMLLLIGLATGTSAVTPATTALAANGRALCSGACGPALQAGCGDGICDAYMGENASICPQDCAATVIPPQVGCGDGVCDAYMGENTSTCAQDCAVNSVTVVPRTVTPATSATPSPVTEETSVAPTDTPMGIPATPSEGGLTSLPGCDLVAYESRAQAWQKGYGDEASPGSFVPSRTDNREVYVCTVQPVGELCIPIYQGLIQASQENLGNIILVDCSTSGSCQIYEGPAHQIGESICFDVTQADNLSCSAGCALAPRQTDLFVLPLFGNVPTRILAPTACLAALLVLGLVLGIIFVARRSQRREPPPPNVPHAPSGWDTIPRSDRKG